ncbi:MAG TPA: glycosyltransferase family 39 protein [Clostridia bacterium]|nr:glycosyltransferase family 39 protein [Clostridia bacterium]
MKINWSLKKLKSKEVTPYLVLGLILLIGFYFRTYKIVQLYSFAHDHDLFSWIVKDIWVNKHFRLIGQETSVDGIYIGPLFYYLLVPFFALFNLDPLSAAIPTTIIGLLTIFSFYFVVSKFFGRIAGLIASFLYAVSISNVFFDRWVVPSQPTILWSIWYLFALLSIIKPKEKLKVLPLVGLLIGLIWHIHIALVPLLLLLPISLIISRKKIKPSELVIPFFILLVLTSPFWLFELRHHFNQFKGFFKSLTYQKAAAQGFYRLQKVFDQASGYLLANLFPGLRLPNLLNSIPFIFISLYGLKNKLFSKKQLMIFASWIVLTLLGQFFSKRPMSEYYFVNISVITITLFSLFLARFYSLRREKILVIAFLIIFALFNFDQLSKRSQLPDGYLAKRGIVEFIKQDALYNNYPCISVNYISDFGRGVGFRYFFWWQGLKLIEPGRGAPVYNIVIPAELSPDEVKITFGNLGVILPKKTVFQDESVCNNPQNQLQPMLGFVN